MQTPRTAQHTTLLCPTSLIAIHVAENDPPALAPLQGITGVAGSGGWYFHLDKGVSAGGLGIRAC